MQLLQQPRELIAFDELSSHAQRCADTLLRGWRRDHVVRWCGPEEQLPSVRIDPSTVPVPVLDRTNSRLWRILPHAMLDKDEHAARNVSWIDFHLRGLALPQIRRQLWHLCCTNRYFTGMFGLCSRRRISRRFSLRRGGCGCCCCRRRRGNIPRRDGRHGSCRRRFGCGMRRGDGGEGGGGGRGGCSGGNGGGGGGTGGLRSRYSGGSITRSRRAGCAVHMIELSPHGGGKGGGVARGAHD